ncbi:MAG TPA: phosphoribosylformylglycinamidine synthase I [Peptococcaceae bacterium]|nr:MAG: Phosphoribosylformylglycinamidine synthase 1 [Clostridia bacterium 41_269]HBT20751.1 phosphoribosylformylglycinamidine synthase I [Peptococcaceae bacterium]
MKFGIVVFPGSNCDADVKHVVERVLGFKADYLWHKDKSVKGYDCIILPGGFSYGDYLREGAIARFSPIMEAVTDYALKGGLVLGICNGFQILLEAGLLSGAMRKNDSLQFRCHDTYLRVENEKTPYTCLCSPGEVLKIPIAHAAGNYYVDENTLKELEESGQVIFRYCGPTGEVTPQYNPNGSLNNIAGITNRDGNILGMMPHPERCAEEIMSGVDGRKIFESIVFWLKERC